MTEGEDRVHSASLHTQPGAEQAVVALPGYYQAIADDIIASDDPVRLALDYLLSTFKSHVDGRDLLDELHPRKTLDIKRRVDGVETWFEGDWLSNVRDARDIAVTVLLAVSGATTASSVGMTSDARNAPNPPPKEAEPWRPDRDRVQQLVLGALQAASEWGAPDSVLPLAVQTTDAILALPSPPDQKKG